MKYLRPSFYLALSQTLRDITGHPLNRRQPVVAAARFIASRIRLRLMSTAMVAPGWAGQSYWSMQTIGRPCPITTWG